MSRVDELREHLHVCLPDETGVCSTCIAILETPERCMHGMAEHGMCIVCSSDLVAELVVMVTDAEKRIEAARQEGREQAELEDFESLVAAHSPLATPPITSKPAKCGTCGGRGRVLIRCPDNRPGCAVVHSKPCPICAGEVKP